jgi:hypothetical protein
MPAPQEPARQGESSVRPANEPLVAELARITPDRFGGMVSPAWRAGIERDIAASGQSVRNASGTTPEMIAEIQTAGARERQSLSGMKRPISPDERREVEGRSRRRDRRAA